jgi:hypothetical protein
VNDRDVTDVRGRKAVTQEKNMIKLSDVDYCTKKQNMSLLGEFAFPGQQAFEIFPHVVLFDSACFMAQVEVVRGYLGA